MTAALASRLVRAPEVQVVVDAAGSAVASAGAQDVPLPAGGLTLLDAFTHPTRLAEALGRVSIHGPRDFIDLTSAVAALVEAGILRDADAPHSLPALPNDWGSTEHHVSMLADTDRTFAFKRAIEEVVKPGDVVLEIGTGTGILSVFAARAGAKKVYAIEAYGLGPVAQQVFEKNGVGDRVELIRGWSTQVTLPERANVLVTETIGNEPLGERIVDTVFDARNRLLTANARLIPSHIRVVGRLVSLSDEVADTHLFTDANLARARERYGVDLGPLSEAERRGTFGITLDTALARTLVPRSDPFTIADVNLSTTELVFSRDVVATVSSSGTVHGVLVHFAAKLGPSSTLTVDPFEIDSSSWRHRIWLLPTAERSAGERIELRYDHAAGVARLRQR
jgi:hypothetical protein